MTLKIEDKRTDMEINGKSIASVEAKAPQPGDKRELHVWESLFSGEAVVQQPVGPSDIHGQYFRRMPVPGGWLYQQLTEHVSGIDGKHSLQFGPMTFVPYSHPES